MDPGLLLSSYYLLTGTASGRKRRKMERVEATGHPWITGITGIIGIIGIIRVDEDNYTLQSPQSVVMTSTTVCKPSHRSRLMLVFTCYFFLLLLSSFADVFCSCQIY